MKNFVFDLRPLDVHMIQRCRWRNPAPTITAPAPHQQLRVHNERAEQNRQAYIAQSAATRGGKVAEPSFA
jgi:hypothetical protein